MSTMPAAANRREPLHEVYTRLVREEGDKDELISFVERRGYLASQIYALAVADHSQQELDAMCEMLIPALAENEDMEVAEDATEREFVRIQLEVVEREIARRESFFAKVDAGQQEAPARTELLAWMVRLGAGFEEEGERAEFYDSFQAIEKIMNRARLNHPAGAQRVATVLREAEALPAEGSSPDVERWLRGMMALELLTQEKGYGGVQIETDAVTRSEGMRARRLFYATQRQDSRYEHLDWPLDLPAGEIADLIESAYKAAFEYAQKGHPEADLQRYLTPSRREEPGRPTPHPQVVAENIAQARVVALGGVPYPMVFGIPPQERVRYAQQIWTKGLPPVPNGRSGRTLLSGGADPRVRWGASTFSYGLLCAVALRPNEILHIHDEKKPDDDRIFDRLTRRATSLARKEPDERGSFPRILRETLLDEGYKAFQRWDKNGQLTVLDPTPETVMVLRESFPPFLHPERPLKLPPSRPLEALEGLDRSLSAGSPPPISLAESIESRNEVKEFTRRM